MHSLFFVVVVIACAYIQMRLHRTHWLQSKMPRRLLLPSWSNAFHTHRCGAVPRWLLLPQGHLRPACLQLRLQVPGGVAQADHVPVALLLPWNEERQHDAVPDRVQLRRAGHVRADAVLPGDVCDMRGEEDVRPVPQGPLLPDGDAVAAVPGGVLLPDRSVGADAVPRGGVLPAGVGQAQGLSCGEDVGGGEQVGRPVLPRKQPLRPRSVLGSSGRARA
jgi:hypothetical protein